MTNALHVVESASFVMVVRCWIIGELLKMIVEYLCYLFELFFSIFLVYQNRIVAL